MRTAVNNPFEPGSDRIPQVWAGRQRELSAWRDRVRPRRVAGLYERGTTLLGEPGIGKSVLVARIAGDAFRGGDLVTDQIRVPRGVDPTPLVARALLELAQQAGLTTRAGRSLGELLARVEQIAVAGNSLTLKPSEGQPAHAALTALLVALGTASLPDGRAVIVHVDEVQNIADDQQLSQLLIAFGDALAYETTTVAGNELEVCLPIVVYLTGLPEFADQASSRSGATFARRFATTLLEPISDDDLLAGLHPLVRDGWPVSGADGSPQRVRISPDAAQRIVALCHGDPFLFQLAGQHAWDAGDDAVLRVADVDRGWERARFEARQHVERLLERLPEMERSMLDAMAELEPDERTLTTIARTMGYERAPQVGPTAQRLDTLRGIISRGRRYSFRARTVEAYLTTGWP